MQPSFLSPLSPAFALTCLLLSYYLTSLAKRNDGPPCDRCDMFPEVSYSTHRRKTKICVRSVLGRHVRQVAPGSFGNIDLRQMQAAVPDAPWPFLRNPTHVTS